MEAKLFKITCLTNMHVGNGDVNFNIIDNEVEKDPVTNFPTINSSGVKGALKEFCKANDFSETDTVFGKESTKKEESKAGKVKFLAAEMLAIPMRASSGDKTYYMVTNEDAVSRYNNLCNAFSINGAKIDISSTAKPETVEVEGVKCALKIGKMNGVPSKIMGEESVALMDRESFKSIPLPVMSRNYLESGVSKNLWYEEIVPHESVFYFITVADDKTLLDKLSEAICSVPVQFGGDASIGYGLCKVEEIGGASNEQKAD